MRWPWKAQPLAPITHRWTGARPIGVDATEAGREIARLRMEGGGFVTLRDIVEAAQPRTSPLHHAFTWHDASAAKAYRAEQATNLLIALTEIELS